MKTLCRESVFLEWEEGKTQGKRRLGVLTAGKLLRNKDFQGLGHIRGSLFEDDYCSFSAESLKTLLRFSL